MVSAGVSKLSSKKLKSNLAGFHRLLLKQTTDVKNLDTDLHLTAEQQTHLLIYLHATGKSSPRRFFFDFFIFECRRMRDIDIELVKKDGFRYVSPCALIDLQLVLAFDKHFRAGTSMNDKINMFWKLSLANHNKLQSFK